MRLIVIISLLFLTHQIQSQWIVNPSGVTGNLRQIAFYNQNTGWIAGDGGTVLKTTNGGTLWFPLNTGISQDLYAITCSDSLTVIACGTGGMIIRSTNSGADWTMGASGTGSTLRSIAWDPYYTNFKAAGDNGVILLSTNNGSTWSPQASSTSSRLNYIIYFSGYSSGYGSEVMGDNGVKKYYSSNQWLTDGGFPASSDNLLAGVRVSRALFSPFAIMCSESGNIYKRRGIPGTANWILRSTGVSTPLRSIADGNFSLNSYGNAGKYLWAVGDNGVIRYSADTGNTWQAQLSGVVVRLNSILMLDSLRGFIAGDGGLIMRTFTGGTIGVQQISSVVPKEFSLRQNYPNPFNPVTSIEFSLPVSSYVRLAIYDAAGREVETLVNGQIFAGVFKTEWNAADSPSGIYFYKFSVNGETETRKMILVK
jgi:photosystem II stability/assembly factor-like uncharacterized protein